MVFVWWGSDNSNSDRYTRGEAWLYTDGEWSTEGFVIKDWCFKTYGIYISDPPSIPRVPEGITDGLSWTTYHYQTNATDPEDDDIRYGWDWDGDDIIDEWTPFVSSGEIINTSHMWNRSGINLVQVLAEDEHQSRSNFSDSLQVNISNDPPLVPEIPMGISIGVVGETYWFSTSTVDPENDNIRYGWDWDGDDDVDEWTELITSGKSINTSHVWDDPGTYFIQVKAVDQTGAYSTFSDPFRVIIVHLDNDPPLKPERPSGPSVGIVGRSYSFSTYTTDINDDRILYLFDWDDGTTSDWIGPFESGQFCNVSHIWNAKGSFQVKVKAKDDVGEESVWSDPLPISMPRTRHFSLWNTHPLLQELVEKLSFLYPLFFIEQIY
jgi:hypothetical protein